MGFQIRTPPSWASFSFFGLKSKKPTHRNRKEQAEIPETSSISGSLAALPKRVSTSLSRSSQDTSSITIVASSALPSPTHTNFSAAVTLTPSQYSGTSQASNNSALLRARQKLERFFSRRKSTVKKQSENILHPPMNPPSPDSLPFAPSLAKSDHPSALPIVAEYADRKVDFFPLQADENVPTLSAIVAGELETLKEKYDSLEKDSFAGMEEDAVWNSIDIYSQELQNLDKKIKTLNLVKISPEQKKNSIDELKNRIKNEIETFQSYQDFLNVDVKRVKLNEKLDENIELLKSEIIGQAFSNPDFLNSDVDRIKLDENFELLTSRIIERAFSSSFWNEESTPIKKDV